MCHRQGKGELPVNIPAFNFSSETAVAAPLRIDFPTVTLNPLLAKTYERTVQVSRQPHTISRSIARSKSTAERLFEATAIAKQWTSQVAMRLDPEARKRFFRQLDNLHDETEWLEGDRPVGLESYKAFVRAYVSGSIGGKPALALTHSGHLVAIWQSGDCKLTIEFLPNDRARYLVSQVVEGEHDRFAGDTAIGRLAKVLQPFSDAHWFNGC